VGFLSRVRDLLRITGGSELILMQHGGLELHPTIKPPYDKATLR